MNPRYCEPHRSAVMALPQSDLRDDPLSACVCGAPLPEAMR